MRVRVGKDNHRETHKLHKNLLQEKSEYFRAACGGSFIESATNEINLPEDDPIGFRCFADWVYTGRLTNDYAYDDLVRGWIVADKLMCQDLQNQIIDNLQSLEKGGPSEQSIQVLIAHEFEDSKLMDYLLSALAHTCSRHWQVNETWLKQFFSSTNGDIVYRLVAKIREYDGNKKGKSPKDLDSCKWHEHESGFTGSCKTNPGQKRKRG